MSKLSYPIFQLISGKEFSRYTQGLRFYKLTFKDEIHRGFKYSTGKHIDVNFRSLPWSPGLHFTEESNIEMWKQLYIKRNEPFVYKRLVTVPDDALIYCCHDKIKANVIILGERESL